MTMRQRRHISFDVRKPNYPVIAADLLRVLFVLAGFAAVAWTVIKISHIGR